MRLCATVCPDTCTSHSPTQNANWLYSGRALHGCRARLQRSVGEVMADVATLHAVPQPDLSADPDRDSTYLDQLIELLWGEFLGVVGKREPNLRKLIDDPRSFEEGVDRVATISAEKSRPWAVAPRAHAAAARWPGPHATSSTC